MVNLEDIIKSEKIKRYLLNLPEETSREQYFYTYQKFFILLDVNPDEYIVDNFFFMENIHEKNKLISKYRKDIQFFKNTISNTINKYGRPNGDSYNRTMLIHIKTLLEYYEIELGNQFWKQTNKFKNKRDSIRDPLTPELLRKILDQCNLQSKCIFLLCATTGSRISSILNLKRKHIDMTHHFPRVHFYSETVKNNISKTKFTTPECKHFLESYLKTINLTPNDYIFPALKSKNKNKPMHRSNATHKFNNALTKIDLRKINDNTGQGFITIQNLKSFYKSNFKCSDIQFINYMCEHNSQLDQRYYNKPINELEKLFKEGYKNILVYELAYDTDEVKRLTKENESLKGQITIITKQLNETKNTFQSEIEQIKDEQGWLFLQSNYKFYIATRLRNGDSQDEILKDMGVHMKKFEEINMKQFGKPYRINRVNTAIKKGHPVMLDSKNKDQVESFFKDILENY